MVHRVTTSDNEWQRVTTNDNEWQQFVQQMTKSDNEWQLVTASESSGTASVNHTVHFKECMFAII